MGLPAVSWPARVLGVGAAAEGVVDMGGGGGEGGLVVEVVGLGSGVGGWRVLVEAGAVGGFAWRLLVSCGHCLCLYDVVN